MVTLMLYGLFSYQCATCYCNLHRIIKSATVSQGSDGKYYAAVLFEFEKPANNYVVDRTKAIGLDYASDGLYVDNNGKVGTNHKYYRESQDNELRVS